MPGLVTLAAEAYLAIPNVWALERFIKKATPKVSLANARSQVAFMKVVVCSIFVGSVKVLELLFKLKKSCHYHKEQPMPQYYFCNSVLLLQLIWPTYQIPPQC